MTRVTVKQGTLEGKVNRTTNGFAYKSYLGIPFAKPPVGDLRFKDPVPAEKWEGILDATKEPNVCAQFERLFKKSYVGVEDCLYLNVYVPNFIPKDEKLPVMFWVHGGAFINGNCNGELFGPQHLIEHNVIIVTTNYRLGPLGFLCLDTPDAPGNVGLKDQALALKWVNKNIREFGGDPHNLTIFGQSAGGASTHFLILSPLTKGMFKRAILQSGTSLNEWAIQRDNINNAFKLGALLGIKTDDKKKLINHLLNVPVQDLVKASYSPTLGDGMLPSFVPVVEKDIAHVSTFLNVEPRSFMRSLEFSDIPLMIGCTSNEGYMGFLTLGDKLGSLISGNVTLDALVEDFRIFVPSHLRRTFADDKNQLVAQEIKEFYFPTEDNLFNRFLDLQSDAAFNKDIEYTAKMYAKQTKTYYYKFSFSGSLNIFKLIFPLPYKEATHGDELAYMFYPRFEELSTIPPPKVTDREELLIKRMTEMWTNFAKYGNPTPTLTEACSELWRPISEDNVYCLDINDDLTLIKDPFGERMKFWEKLDTLLIV